MHTINRYRLRISDIIVGYLRLEGSRKYYSTDGMWWNGIPVPYEKADRFSGLKDKNNRMLYEGDVVSIPFPNEPEVFKNMLISFEDGQCILSEVSGMVRIEISDMDRISGIVFLGFAFEDGLI